MFDCPTPFTMSSSVDIYVLQVICMLFFSIKIVFIECLLFLTAVAFVENGLKKLFFIATIILFWLTAYHDRFHLLLNVGFCCLNYFLDLLLMLSLIARCRCFQLLLITGLGCFLFLSLCSAAEVCIRFFLIVDLLLLLFLCHTCHVCKKHT